MGLDAASSSRPLLGRRQSRAFVPAFQPASTPFPPGAASSGPSHTRRRYLVAVGCAAVVIGARAALAPVTNLPFVTFFPGVLLSAWYGGLGPGLLTTALCACAVAYFWMTPGPVAMPLQAEAAINLSLFALVSVVIAWVTAGFHEAGHRMARMLEAVGDGVYALDAEWRIVFVNRRFAEMVGAAPSAMIGRPLGDFFPGFQSRPFGAALRQAMEGHAAVRNETYTPVLERWLESEIYPTRDGATVLVRDVSARRLVEEQRASLLAAERAARADSERAVRLKDEFLATLSHELRTPLNAVMGWAHILSVEPHDSPRARRAVGAVQRNAAVLKQLVDDLLDVSSIVSGKLQVSATRVDLVRVVRDAIDVVRASADAKELALVAHTPNGVVWVNGDAARLQQVAWNLLSNAVKFTPPGGRIDVTLTSSADGVRLCVRDSGIGIAPEFLPHVFDRFVQAEGGLTRSAGGLGLGLAIARHLVEAHGGRLLAESAGKGHGATFTITLPPAVV